MTLKGVVMFFVQNVLHFINNVDSLTDIQYSYLRQCIFYE